MSLFPAYTESSPPYARNSDDEIEILTSEQNVLTSSSFQRFSSFAPVIEQQKVSENQSGEIVLTVSDSGSDVQIFSTRVSKKKKRKRKKREKKLTSKSSRKSSSPGTKKKGAESKTWSFVAVSDLKPTTSEESFIFDRKRDIENLQFDSFYKRHVATYKFGMQRLLGGSNEISKLIFGAGKFKPARYFARKYQRYKPGEKVLPQKRPQGKIPPPAHLLDEEFIEFDSTWNKGDEKLVFDPVIQMYRPIVEETMEGEDQKIDISEGASTYQEAELLARSKKFNRALEDSPHDVTLWLSFVKFQDKAQG